MCSLKDNLVPFLEKVELFRRRFSNPEKYIRKIFYKRVGYQLNLRSPRTYNEKLQWLKLYWHHPLLPTLVDKYAVKEYVSKLIGEQYIIPTLGVWDNVSDIDWESLPNQFVLKCTHDSGGLVICPDKSKLHKAAAVCKLKKSLAQNYYYYGFEWPYKNVKPRIIAESYMHDSKLDDLPDYKFFCFDGKVEFLFVATDRNKKGVEVKFDWYDSYFNLLPLTHVHPQSYKSISKPSTFDEMKNLAEILSKGFPHVRVDFYEINKQVYFGEMTFYPDAGWAKFEPVDWDYAFGELLNIPSEKII